MRRHPRIRRIAKWLGLSACLTIVAAWVFSEMREVYIRVPSAGVLCFSSGYFGYIDAQSTAGWITGVMIKWTDPFEWTSHPPIIRSWLGGIHVADWLVLIVLLLPTLALFHFDRRGPIPGHCPCGYNLTGNTTGRCPECGTAHASSR